MHRSVISFLVLSVYLGCGYCLLKAHSTLINVDDVKPKTDGQDISKVGLLSSSMRDEDIEDSRQDTVAVSINLTSSQHATDSKFLSVTIDSGVIAKDFHGFDFSSKQLQTIAHALSPCILRLGGTSADFLLFDPSSPGEIDKVKVKRVDETVRANVKSDDVGVTDHSNYTMSGSLWKNINQFTRDVGWDILFDFNVFLRKDGRWDPDNAKSFLDFSDAHGIDILEFQLGNEPNAFMPDFNVSITPQMLAKDFQILKDLLSQYPRYKNSPLCGPDVTNLATTGCEYFVGFLQGGGYNVVSELSFHQYYLNGNTATVEEFTRVDVLDKLKKSIDIEHEIANKFPKSLPLRFTETSSCYHGGAKGISDAYVAGFLWLDKLGVSANYGVTKVFRQSFYGGNYALLGEKNQPLPDFYLSVLHKRLVLGPVFNVAMQPDNPKLRIYAQCSRTDFYKYPNGSITVSYLNVNTVNHTVAFPQFKENNHFLYSLTPGDSNGLKSKYVALNGKVLEMHGTQLPPLTQDIIRGDITLPALSFGFIVIPSADASLCGKHMKSAQS